MRGPGRLAKVMVLESPAWKRNDWLPSNGRHDFLVRVSAIPELLALPDSESIDRKVDCTSCDAVCCRLTVVLMPEDVVPGHLTTRTEHGIGVMARDEEGWCVAIDQRRMCCSIYESRPTICRKFAMGGAYCREVRNTHRDELSRGIPLTMY